MTWIENTEIFIGWLCSLIFSWLSFQSHLFEPPFLSMFQIFLPNTLFYINYITEPRFNVLWPILAVKDCGVLVQVLGDWTARCPVYFSRPDILSWLRYSNLCPASLYLSCFDQLSAGLALLGFLLSLLWVLNNVTFYKHYPCLHPWSTAHACILGCFLSLMSTLCASLFKYSGLSLLFKLSVCSLPYPRGLVLLKISSTFNIIYLRWVIV